MASYLAYLNFFNFPVRKSYTVNERANPFDELDDDEFRKRFRLTKATMCGYCFPRWTVTHSTIIIPSKNTQWLSFRHSFINCSPVASRATTSSWRAGLVHFDIGEGCYTLSYTCVKLLTVWLAVSYITIGTRLQFHSVESHFDVCDDSLVYRSRCNLDRSTRNACLVAIATVYNRWQSLLTRLSADRLKLTQPIRLITAVLRSSCYCVLTFLWWNETISSYLILSHETVTNITQNGWMDSV